jgi:hypothetical protein
MLALSSQFAVSTNYKAFPQVWNKKWCPDGYAQITSQAECDAAAVELGLTKYGPSSTNEVSEYLPSCMIASMGLRWNKYGLLDLNMTTGDWLGFTAICKVAGLFECIEDGGCVACTPGQQGCTDKGTCEARLPACNPPPKTLAHQHRDVFTAELNTALKGPEVNPTHYGNPSGGCESDELAVTGAQIGLTGSLCAPHCKDDGTCPTDFPAGVTALPQCALSSGSDKYCLLECIADSSCDTGATCKGATPSQYGICTYDAAPSPPGPSPSSHYEDPFAGCGSDEIAVAITGTAGQVCAPKCNPDSSCPTDVPEGVTAVPQCALQDPSGNKYCILECLSQMNCGDKASCKNASPTQYGICTYDSLQRERTLDLLEAHRA